MKTITHIISLLFIVSSISFANKSDTPPCCDTVPHQHEEAGLPPGQPSAHSVFNVESLWENQTGKQLPLNHLGGRLQVVAMVYTSCQYACPRILADLKSIQSSLEETAASELGFCLITIDPERDTVEAYKTYAKKNGLDSERWTFLRGEPGDILELANLLGVRYKKMPDGEFSHSNIITLLKPDGEVGYQLNGLGADPGELITTAKHLMHMH